VPDMKLSPNVGSDRSWVWNAAADVSEGEPEAQTLAIRFANSDSMLTFPFISRLSHDLILLSRCQSLQGSVHQGAARKREALPAGIGGMEDRHHQAQQQAGERD
jgi:hypothetical protein